MLENVYFVDGSHDDLLTMLAKIESFSVTSRTSVMRYQESDMNIPEITSELGANQADVHIALGALYRHYGDYERAKSD